jgi:hypothetical protein
VKCDIDAPFFQRDLLEGGRTAFCRHHVPEAFWLHNPAMKPTPTRLIEDWLRKTKEPLALAAPAARDPSTGNEKEF